MKRIEQICNEFLASKSYIYSKFKPSMGRNLVTKFIDQFPFDDIDEESLTYGIKNIVTSYSRDKDRAIEFFKLFIEYLSVKEGIHVHLSFPPIPVSNSFERMMYIAKAIQDPSGQSMLSEDDLADRLWVTKETIVDDIKRLMGDSDDSISFMDQRLIISDIQRIKGAISYDSTMHPIFIAANLTQIIVLLSGIREMCKNQLFRSYGLPLAQSLWRQLSDYGQTRIIKVCEEMLDDPDVDWFRNLYESKPPMLYRSEDECSSEQGPMAIIACMKNYHTCDIQYLSPGGDLLHYQDVIIKGFVNGTRKETFTILFNGEEIVLNVSGVTSVKSTRNRI